MPKDESGQYALVDPEEYEHALDSPTVVPVPKKSLRWVIIRVVVLTEIVNLVLLAIGFLLFWYRPWIPSTTTPPPTTFNVTSTFAVDKHDLKLVANTSEADAFWMSITRDKNNGLVSLPKALAEERGLEASGLATKDGEIVFQVDAFHQLHCLQRIRQDIIYAPYLLQLNPHPTSATPYRAHTLHCIDYLRQALMCNADATLVSTGKDLEFDHSPARQCRDFDALSAWVMSRPWDADLYFGLQWTNDTRID